MTYAEIRQRVLAQLSPEMDRVEIPTLLYTLAYIALHRDAQVATAAMLTGSGPDRTDRTCRPHTDHWKRWPEVALRRRSPGCPTLAAGGFGR